MKIYVDAYLALNLGDDLFVDILCKRYPNHQFYAISKAMKGYTQKNLKVFSNSYLFRVLKKFQWEKHLANQYDLVVSIGGSMYMENKDSKRDFSLGNKEHYILGSNFGPYQTEEYYQNIYQVFEQAEDVCFREKHSYELFKDLSNVRYASDIVFSMPTENITITNRKRAIFSIISCSYKLNETYTKAYEEKMIELIELLQKKGYEICLMSFCKQEKDEEAIEAILSRCKEETKQNIETYYYHGNMEEALNVLGDSQIIIGSRFHANILGLLLGKTILPVLYSDKTKHVLEEMNIKTPMMDIRKMEDFNINEITKQDLERHFEVEKQKEDAKRHFEKLDERLRKEN